MPIYEYQCKCGKIKDVLMKMSQKDIVICDKCKKKMKRIISAANFDLRGEGFYCNDYYRRRKNVNEP
jgi:putative FmdB family regulatory protein